MTELRQAREVDMVPEELRYVPQVKSDIIIQRRNVSLAPIEAANEYTRTGTNTITFNIQGHRELSQLLDTKSMYFTWQVKVAGGYPVEDVANLIEEVIISSNGRVIERIRHAQYIQHFVRGYGMSRKSKARLGKRAGFMRFEDRTSSRFGELVPRCASTTSESERLPPPEAPFVGYGPGAADAPRRGVGGTTMQRFLGTEGYTRMSETLATKRPVPRQQLQLGAWGPGSNEAAGAPKTQPSTAS